MRILVLTLGVLISVHGVQLSAWVLTRETQPPSVPVSETVSPAAARRTARLLRRLADRPQRISRLHGAAPAASEPSSPSFPFFGAAVAPVSVVPDWGAMTSAAEWDRTFDEMPASAFVPLPAYDLAVLTRPMADLLRDRRAQVGAITAKLTYSTRYFGAYDLDAGEFSGNHPGIDIKLAEGTPIGSVAGGRVQSVRERPGLGLTVIVEHRHPADGTFFSVYGHLGSASVAEGSDVAPGTILGVVGMTGRTTAPHLHLQIDRSVSTGAHTPYVPLVTPSPQEADRFGMHPIGFLSRYGGQPGVIDVALQSR